jgi:iron complex outermembrane receptor protein
MSAILLLSVVTSARAQEEPSPSGNALEEITVTARRVEENLMTVPVSVSALSASDIENRDIKDMTEISLFEPSFHFVNQQGGQSPINDRSGVNVSFRGLVESGGSGSVFIDGAPVVDGQPPTLDEIERVEVLKGPQSAYFGRSTFAGAINYITKDPSLTTFGGTVSAESSSYNSNDESIGLDVPVINDVLGLRFSGRHQIKGGEYFNAADTDQVLGEQGTDSASLTVLFKPIDRLRIKGWFNWIGDDDGPPAEGGIYAADGFFNFPSPAGATFKGGYISGPIPNVNQLNPAKISCDCTMTPFLQSILVQNSPGFHVIFDPTWQRAFGLRRNELQDDVKIDYEFLPGYNLSSLTAYHYDKRESHWDIDQQAGYDVPNPYYGLPNTLSYYSFDLAGESLQTDWSEELRVTSPQDRPLKWSLGADYLYSSTPGSSLWGEIPFGPTNFGTITPSSTETPAIFGGVSYEFLPKLTLALEARYQWDKLKTQTTYSGNAPTTGVAAEVLAATFKSFSPRVSLDYQYAPGSTAYALFSRGYKPGGFNTAVLYDSPAQLAYIASQGGNESLTFAQEQLDNYEFGVKSTFLDDRARVTVAFYYDRWLNGQVPVNIDVPANPLLPLGGGNTEAEQAPVTNAGLIILKGIEYAGDFQVTSHLLLNTSFAINDTDVVHYQTCSDCVDILGTTTAHGHVPLAPKYSATASGTYSDRLPGSWTGNWSWFGRVDYIYSGSKFVDYTNIAWIQAATLVNLYVGINQEQLRIEGFVKNATNESAPISVDHQVNPFTFFSQNQNTIDYALPDKRTIGVRADYRF